MLPSLIDIDIDVNYECRLAGRVFTCIYPHSWAWLLSIYQSTMLFCDLNELGQAGVPASRLRGQRGRHGWR
jgi:hypothetical protein